MSERGVFAVDRGVWEHPMFADEPFTEREAWLWMVSAAAWISRRVRVGKAMIDLDRGQLAFATRFLASRWKWAHSKVVRFLKRLEIDTMVSTSATRDATLITICNYDKYAFGRNAAETQNGTQAGTVTERYRNKEEELKKDNNKELKKETGEVALIPDDWPVQFSELFWQAYPNKVGKPKALAKLNVCRKRGILFADVMSGLDRYIRSKPPDRAWLNPETFLNQERWTDQPASVASQGNQNGRRTVHDAANDLLAKINALDEPAPGRLRGGAGEGALRLLPPR
jgi:hypothetical protein